MTILLAPDKFKGSLPASEVAQALRRGILSASPELDVASVPVADGGDGTLDAAFAAGYERVPVVVSGPTGEPVQTAYARSGRTAVVEMADASGLSRLPEGVLEPLRASSRGTGEVMAAAIEAGCRTLVLGIGGSASTDGGAGLLQALGARLLDADGADIGPGGSGLTRLAQLDLSDLSRLDGVEVVVACDVDNPLVGPHGAAAVYGPQKGAGEDDVVLLDAALARWADTVAAATGADRRDEPGAGAAGGVGFAALAVLGARLQPGVDLVLDLVGFDEKVRGADWVVVGEGSLDAQSLRGKAPVGVAARARAAGARVLAACGHAAVSEGQLAAAGIEMVYALSDLEPDQAASMTNAAALLEQVGARMVADGWFG